MGMLALCIALITFDADEFRFSQNITFAFAHEHSVSGLALKFVRSANTICQRGIEMSKCGQALVACNFFRKYGNRTALTRFIVERKI